MTSVHIFIGTKAQFIKVAPVLKEFDKRNLSYRLIDSCQHKDITTDLRRLFGIREPDVSLRTGYDNINTLSKALLWTTKIVASLVFKPAAFRKEVFGDARKGLCLIHGDTLSTLLGLIIAKRFGFAVGHLEAGLRSFDIFNPFPEELIRLICMRYSDFLFAPSGWAKDNLKNFSKQENIFDIGGNTVFDSIQEMLPRGRAPAQKPNTKYALMSIHRFENIYRKKRLAFIVDMAQTLSQNLQVVFITHQPTLKRLNAAKLINKLANNKAITMLSLAHYDEFLALLQSAQFVITDGGSIQEECYYLNKPCLLLRKKTERRYGIGENVCLGNFDKETILRFIQQYPSFTRKENTSPCRPSQAVADIVEKITARVHQ